MWKMPEMLVLKQVVIPFISVFAIMYARKEYNYWCTEHLWFNFLPQGKYKAFSAQRSVLFLMPFKKTVAVCSEKQNKPLKTLYEYIIINTAGTYIYH